MDGRSGPGISAPVLSRAAARADAGGRHHRHGYARRSLSRRVALAGAKTSHGRRPLCRVAFDGEWSMIQHPPSLDGRPPEQPRRPRWRFLRHVPSMSILSALALVVAIFLYPYI